MPRFSVIIPAYNRASLIGATLDSVIAQPGEPAEIIVVDDGSKDATRDVVRRYGSRVTLLEQANKGPSIARNLGLGRATGEYVCFLDSDDLWLPWTCAAYTEVIERAGKPAFIAGKPGVFTSDAELRGIMSPAGGAVPVRFQQYRDYYASSKAWEWFSASSFVMRADALRAVGGMIDKWINAEDADLALRLGASPGFAVVREPHTFAWRSHSGSAVSNVQKTVDGITYLLDAEEAGLYPGGSDRAFERREIIARHARYAALLCLETSPRAVGAAWSLYARTFWTHAALGKIKFLAGFMGKMAMASAGLGGGAPAARGAQA